MAERGTEKERHEGAIPVESPVRLPVVAIVGRPNVGKSTLFNRLIGSRRALVHDEPGLTRDRHYGEAVYQNKRFIVIDTGGYEDRADSPMLSLMRSQTLIAIDEADHVVLLSEEGIPNDPIDAEIVDRLRASGKPFYLAVNKCDDIRRENQAIADFSVYGLDEVFPLSALHGDGVYELLDSMTVGFPEADDEEELGQGPIRVAIVGRQNVGKSTLTNRLLGEERMIASEIAGTTRDAIDTLVRENGQDYLLIDTAGIRRRGKIKHGAERLSVHSSFAAIKRCEVAILLLDATEGVTLQDNHIAGYVLEEGKACILVLNKWDIVKDRENYGEYIKRLRDDFRFLKWAPILTISARTGQRAHKLWSLISTCADQFRREFNTSDLNRILAQATAYLSPPITANRQLQIKYVTQTGTCPPTLTFFVNDPKLLHFSYERFLQNQFRRQLALEGTPLQFRMKRKAAPRGWERDSRQPRPPQPAYRPGQALDIEEEYEAGVYEEDE